ncbi:MAG: efflux RND transporter periplasmic adaptor subunit [Candidatus Melainabacteria bacterium]|nr:efflux RND transporter periplasmic adaptor subunit [Candidatus Melainabacteria bacterium]
MVAKQFKRSIALYATMLCLHGCSSTDQKATVKIAEKNSDATEEKVPRVNLPTTRVQRSIVNEAITFPGKVSALPDCSVSISPNMAGKLTAVTVVPGQVVSKGQLIARLDDRQLRAQLLVADAPQKTALNGVAQAKINLDLAQKTLTRTESLYAKEIVAQKDVVAARSAVDLAKSQVEAAQAKVAEVKTAPAQVLTQLSFMSVYSPISGIVAHRYLNIGSSVDPTTPIIHVVNLSQVMVNANMPADAPTNTVLTKNDGHLKEGQQVNVSISTAKISAILVPETSIVPGHEDPAENFLYVVHDNKLKLTKVKTGGKTGNNVPVLSGLNNGDEIVTAGAYGVADGAELERKPPEAK